MTCSVPGAARGYSGLTNICLILDRPCQHSLRLTAAEHGSRATYRHRPVSTISELCLRGLKLQDQQVSVDVERQVLSLDPLVVCEFLQFLQQLFVVSVVETSVLYPVEQNCWSAGDGQGARCATRVRADQGRLPFHHGVEPSCIVITPEMIQGLFAERTSTGEERNQAQALTARMLPLTCPHRTTVAARHFWKERHVLGQRTANLRITRSNSPPVAQEDCSLQWCLLPALVVPRCQATYEYKAVDWPTGTVSRCECPAVRGCPRGRTTHMRAEHTRVEPTGGACCSLLFDRSSCSGGVGL